MIGVIVNVITVILGSSIGLLFKKGIPERVSKAAMIGLGACTLYIGISGSLGGKNTLILIVSVVLGVITGTLLNIDGAINRLAEKVEEKLKKDGKGVSVTEGLVSATLLFCVGSMTVTGSIQAGLTGDNSILITKAMLDLVSSMMLASSLGIGVLLSALAVFVIQGGLVIDTSRYGGDRALQQHTNSSKISLFSTFRSGSSSGDVSRLYISSSSVGITFLAAALR